MKMKILSDHPFVVAGTGAGAVGINQLDIISPYIQFGILVISFVVVLLTAIIKAKELFGGKK